MIGGGGAAGEIQQWRCGTVGTENIGAVVIGGMVDTGGHLMTTECPTVTVANTTTECTGRCVKYGRYSGTFPIECGVIGRSKSGQVR